MCLRYTYNTSVLLVTFTVYPDHRKSVSIPTMCGLKLPDLHIPVSIESAIVYADVFSTLQPLSPQRCKLFATVSLFPYQNVQIPPFFSSISADLDVERVESPEFSPYFINKRDSFFSREMLLCGCFPKQSLNHGSVTTPLSYSHNLHFPGVPPQLTFSNALPWWLLSLLMGINLVWKTHKCIALVL